MRTRTTGNDNFTSSMVRWLATMGRQRRAFQRVLLVGVAACAWSHPADALDVRGGVSVDLQTPEDDECSRWWRIGGEDELGPCLAGRPGDVTLDVHFTAPPTQVQVDMATEQLTRASRLICDASEGYMRLKTVWFTTGEEQLPSADVLWFPQPGQEFKSGDHVYIFDYVWDPAGNRYTGMRSHLLAHELGHLLFGVADGYGKLESFWGPAFDGQGYDDGMGGGTKFRSVFGEDLAYVHLPGPDPSFTAQRHTLLQGSGIQACVNPAGNNHQQDNPFWWKDVRCMSDADCEDFGGEGLGDYDTCALDPKMTSELSSDASGYDEVAGTALSCPGPLPASELVGIGYYFGAGTCTRDADADGQDLDAFAGEECDDGTEPLDCPAGDTTKPMSCSDCFWDRSTCFDGMASTCPDGVVSGDEECDDAVSTMIECDDPLYGNPLWQGQMTCNNCLWDRIACTLPGDIREVNVLGKMPGAREYEKVTIRDESVDEGRAYHELHVNLLRRLGDKSFFLHVGIDAGDFGGTPGQYHKLAAWEVEWDETTDRVATIAGEPPPHLLVLGSSTAVSSHMCDASGSGDPCAGVPELERTTPTGDFANGAAELVLEVNLDQLVRGQIIKPDRDEDEPVTFYPRRGVTAAGIDMPQVGLPTDKSFEYETGGSKHSVTTDFFCRAAFNEATQRYELTSQAWRQLKETVKFRADCADNRDCVNDVCEGATLPECIAPDGPLSIDDVLDDPTGAILDEWQVFAAHAEDTYGLTVRPGTVAALPIAQLPPESDPSNPVICPAPEFKGDVLAENPAEIVLALDRSYSMSQKPLKGDGSRLDFAKAGARALLQVHARDVDPVKIGLVWFKGETEVVEPPPGFTGGLRRLVLTDDPADDGDVTPDQLADFLVDSKEGSAEYPKPAGDTAIGEALETSQNLFTEGISQLQSIVLLSDLEETAVDRGLTTIDPVDKIEELRASMPLTPRRQTWDRVRRWRWRALWC